MLVEIGLLMPSPHPEATGLLSIRYHHILKILFSRNNPADYYNRKAGNWTNLQAVVDHSFAKHELLSWSWCAESALHSWTEKEMPAAMQAWIHRVSFNLPVVSFRLST